MLLHTDFVTELSILEREVVNSSINGTDDGDCDQGFAIQLLEYLNKYYTIVIIIFGLIGNGLSAVVFLGTQLRSRSSSYYLATLAVSDAVFLFTLLITYLEIVDIDLYSAHNISCKLLNYLSYVSSFLSVWLIVSFTIERFIAVQYPLQRPRMCTVKRAKMIVLGLVLCAVTLHAYIFVTSGVMAREKRDEIICAIIPEYKEVMSILNILDMVLTLILPVLLIVTMNTMIAVQLYRFSRLYTPPLQVYHQKLKLRHRSDSEQTQTASSVVQAAGTAANENAKPVRDEEGIIIIHYINQGRSSRTSQQKHGSGHQAHNRSSSSTKVLTHKLQFNITKMLLIISTVFIGLNLPSYVIRIYIMNRETMECSVFMAQQYFQLLFYTHFSINFLLYSIYGVAFRHALFLFASDKLRCRCFGQNRRVTFMYKCMHVISSRK